MKVPLLVSAAVFAGLLGLSAQSPQPSPSGDQKPDETVREKPGSKWRDRLPPEVLKRFADARKKALEDPQIQALRETAGKANKEFFAAMRKKMIEIDPGLADLVKDRLKEGGGPGFGKGKDNGFASLEEGERQRLMAARTVAKNDPGVQAAEQKKNAAQTPEERMTALKEYRRAMDEAILKADPSLAPVLEKIKPPKRQKPAGTPGDPAAMTDGEST